MHAVKHAHVKVYHTVVFKKKKLSCANKKWKLAPTHVSTIENSIYSFNTQDPIYFSKIMNHSNLLYVVKKMATEHPTDQGLWVSRQVCATNYGFLSDL